MKNIMMLLAAALVFGQMAIPGGAQTSHTVKHKHKPKSEITKLEHARKTNHTVRQITPDPKKSPGKHADDLSKNVNHEVNRESKDVNHGVNDISKGVNHAFQKKKK